MTRRRFHCAPLPAEGGAVWLEGDEGRHLARVLRARRGDEVALFDGHGRVVAGGVEDVERDRVLVRIAHDLEAAAPLRTVTLCASIPKGKRMEWLVEKTVEAGVAAILPVAWSRSERRTAGDANLTRWRRAALEAAKQCGRADVPGVAAPVSLDDALTATAGSQRVVARADAGAMPSPAGPVSVFVGPEGGFRDDELAALTTAGATGLALGGLVLRVETAAVLAVHRLAW